MPYLLLLLPFGLAIVACDDASPFANDDVIVGIDPVGADGACSFSDRTFDDVMIPRGADCTFTNVQVEGNIKMNRDARLTATGLTVTGSSVLGDIQFEQGGSTDVRDTFIDGNLQLESNDGRLVARGNTIEGDQQAFQNRGGPLTFSDNRIDGNLQCQSNSPAPTGGGNVVGGNKEDQCSAL